MSVHELALRLLFTRVSAYIEFESNGFIEKAINNVVNNFNVIQLA